MYLGFSQQQINEVLRNGVIKPFVSVYSPYAGYIAEINPNSSINSEPTAQAGSTRINSSEPSGMSGMSQATNQEIPSVEAISTGQALQIREGQYVNAGQTLFSLVNTDQVWAEFFANSEQLNGFKNGTKIMVNAVNSDGQGQEVKVNLIQPYYREGFNYSLIRANLPNVNRLWKVGQLINVLKKTELEGNWVPKTAVLQLGKKYIVFVNRNAAFVPVYVDVNAITAEWVDVGNSLKSDQKIAHNAWFLVDSESFIKAERL